MTIQKIVNLINEKLAGETLLPSQLVSYMDAVIDDINIELNACFPVFSEVMGDEQLEDTDYNLFPDSYIRTVVVTGAAHKYFVTDEEGAMAAQQYSYDYTKYLFIMKRDYSLRVPAQYQADDSAGYLVNPGVYSCQDQSVGRMFHEL